MTPKITTKARASSASAPAYVALLRGINVGGNYKLPMKDLAAMFAKMGCTDVKTYIQSGNVIFRADDSVAARVPQAIAKAIADRSGMKIPVVVRKATELRKIAENNPFLARATDESRLYVYFLADRPAKTETQKLDPARSPPDEFIVKGSEIYLHCPNRFGGTKLTNAYFDSKLGTVSTARNWRTVLKLVDLAGG
ncbi:MAG: DUF1697 domain-containing protein [Polyangiaceae bacterium]